MNPVVSVVIPAYRHADLILQTVQSVFDQTFTESVEIIVVNDGSPDHTGDVLRLLMESGKIIYVEQENQGQAAARNRGIGLARGEFVALLDDDDLMPPDKLAWQVQALRENPNAAMVYGVPRCIDEAGQPMVAMNAVGVPHGWQNFIPAEEDPYQQMIQGNYLPSPGQTLIRREALVALGQPLDPDPTVRGCDDWDLWLRLAERWDFVAQDKPALLYRLHTGNASKNWRAMCNASLQVVRKHLRRHRTDPVRYPQVKKAYRFLRRWLAENLLAEAQRDRETGNGALALEKLNFILRLRPQYYLRDLPFRFYIVTLLRQRNTSRGAATLKLP